MGILKKYGVLRKVRLENGTLLTEKILGRVITKDEIKAKNFIFEGDEFEVEELIEDKIFHEGGGITFISINDIFEFEDDEAALLWYKLHRE
jgi:hypothetical protein